MINIVFENAIYFHSFTCLLIIIIIHGHLYAKRRLYYRKIFYCVTRDQKNKYFNSDYL